MAKLDKDMFEKIGFSKDWATYVPLSCKVAKILRRHFTRKNKYKYILVSYILHKEGENIMFLIYLCEEYPGAVFKGPGICCTMDKKINRLWTDLAEDIALSHSECAVKHKTKKDIYDEYSRTL